MCIFSVQNCDFQYKTYLPPFLFSECCCMELIRPAGFPCSAKKLTPYLPSHQSKLRYNFNLCKSQEFNWSCWLKTHKANTNHTMPQQISQRKQSTPSTHKPPAGNNTSLTLGLHHSAESDRASGHHNSNNQQVTILPLEVQEIYGRRISDDLLLYTVLPYEVVRG